MILDESLYNWSRYETKVISITESPFLYDFEQPLKIYRFEGTGTISIYSDETQENLLFTGELPFEPTKPIACDNLYVQFENVPLELTIISEIGIEKIDLSTYLNTIENMEVISNTFNDDGIFTTTGLSSFLFNGVVASTIYISSNHFIGLGSNSEQLKICRRDGCSTAIYRQLGQVSSGVQFLKIRFEGYTKYNSRVEENRLIFELFLLSNNDMFLNVIQTPTSSYTGISELVCNNTTTPLVFSSGTSSTFVSFYHQDEQGQNWVVDYKMYEEVGSSDTVAYLLKRNNSFYTIKENEVIEVPITNLTAAMFLKYGLEKIPSSEILVTLENPIIYQWKSSNDETKLKANVKAYPYPQTLISTIDMSHASILGIKLLTAEFSGDVRVSVSYDNGISFSEEIPLSTWINTNVNELWNNITSERKIVMYFVLHDDAKLSRFKITYIV